MMKFFAIVAVLWCINAKGIQLNLSDEMKSMLSKSNWDHQKTDISIHGPMTLDVHSNFKLKDGEAFLRSQIVRSHRPLNKDGVYTMYPDLKTNRTVFCDMTTDGGGWTVLQRRQNGDINFYRNWKDYKNVFGHADDEYWLGNGAIHALTKDGKQMLRIDLQRFSREKAYATCSCFYVENESNKYKLKLGTCNGTNGPGLNSLTYSNGAYFSTMDSDQETGRVNCAEVYKSGWWHKDCMYANLNDEIKSILSKSNWDHQKTNITLHGPMTLDVHSNFKMKDGEIFLNSGVYGRHRDCSDIKKNRPSSRDGVYTIYPDLNISRTVFCDMTTAGGGWTVIQRRQSGKINFYRNWKDYKNGFGHIDDEYWLGNDAIHALTKDGKQMLRVDLQKFSGEKAHATYSSFFVDNEAKKYKLTVGTFKGTNGLADSLTYSSGAYFSTNDVDNDMSGAHCAQVNFTGWWLKSCSYCNLNGLYRKGASGHEKYLVWYHWGNKQLSLKSSAMMIRPKPGA
uniref:Angiopoietin-2-like n=1 Tax=Crassostrea virginica TaxID=6565 RepID=A0A8B8BZ89_CRAVI|nr:angiopoietin-2-like [Crassostrea virginica]